MFNIDVTLEDAIKNDKVIVFAGSGLSRQFNLPDWTTLAEEIIAELEKKYRSGDLGLECFTTLMKKDWLTPLQVLSILEKRYRADIIGFVQNKLKISASQDFRLHKKVLQLSRKIVTTNYDKAFESASANQLTTVLPDNKYALARLQNTDGFIFKIHGDVDNLGNAILFESNYQSLYKATPENPAVRELKSMFTGRKLLFLGFGLNDPYLEEMFTTLFDQYDKLAEKHYVITTDKNFGGSKVAQYVTPLVIEEYSELDGILDMMITMKEDRSLSNEPVVHNLRPKTFFSFLGRENSVEDVMKRLKGELSPVVIEGFQGVGKTSLAIEVGYACINLSSVKYQNTASFDYVIWVAPNDYPTGGNWLVNVLDTVARVMNNKRITGLKNENDKEREIQFYLTASKKTCLIIIDNYEVIKSDELEKWITERLPVVIKVLITTSVNIPVRQSRILLEGLAVEDGVRLVKQLIDNDGKTSATEFPKEQLLNLVTLTGGNPRALELSIAAILQGKLSLSRIKQELPASLTDIFKELHERCWLNLTESSKTLLAIFPQFIGSHSISKDALYKTCPLSIETIDQSLPELLNWNLISINVLNSRYTIHPITSGFVKTKLTTKHQQRFQKRWTGYFLDFVRNHVIRVSPKPVYWNALVSDGMNDIEEEWTAILKVIQYAVDTQDDVLLIDMVMMLVHFMDSRFYNQERLNFVRKAIEACERRNMKYEEALLRIDALGWTYVEETRFDDALTEIDKGLQILSILPRSKEIDNLEALAMAWQGRIKLEQGSIDDASGFLQKANDIEVDSWIQTRIKMAEGDIAMQQGDFNKAITCYLAAEKLTDPQYEGYGFEGHNYQINPRLGFAYLESNNLEEAKKKFEALEQDDYIAIGRLYAKYGLARIDYERGVEQSDKNMQLQAMRTINSIEKELKSRTTSNLLQVMIHRFLISCLKCMDLTTTDQLQKID